MTRRRSTNPLFTSLVVVLGSALLSAAGSSGPAAARSADCLPSFAQGETRCTAVNIRKGERVLAVADLMIVASESVVVDGLLLARPGVSIRIVAPKIIVRGAIRAGDGANGSDVFEPGQNGGHIELRAKEILLPAGATIKAGNGGKGGFAANGGAGGDIRFPATAEVTGGSGNTLEAGDGGRGGEGVNGYSAAARDGGSGGEAGSVGPVPAAGG